MYIENSDDHCLRIRCGRKLMTVESYTPLLSPCRRRRRSASCDQTRRSPKCCGLEVPNLDGFNRSKLTRHLMSSVESDPTKQKLIQAYLKRLNLNQLYLLETAIFTQNGCVPVKDGQIRLGDLGIIEPRSLICRLFRFFDAPPSFQLKRHNWVCEHINEGLVCVNPWHYSIISENTNVYDNDDIVNGIPPQLTTSVSSIKSNSTRNSVATASSMPDDPTITTWARVRYWEEKIAIHRTYHINSPSVHVSDGARTEPNMENVCLGVLHSTSDVDDVIERTRSKIGRGVCLSKEENGIWVYNISDHPLFVHSCNEPLTVRRLPSMHCINAFRPELADKLSNKNCLCSRIISGPVDHRSLRISFAKGWGPGYKRLDITQCPCWLEVLLRRLDGWTNFAPPLPPKT